VAVAVRVEPWDVENRLAELGFKKDELLAVVESCVAQHAFCSVNDPPNAKGYEIFRWGVRRLREIKCIDGWDRDDTNGYSTLVNHRQKIRVAVINSDEGTGDPNPEVVPQNRTRKGVKSLEVALANEWAKRQGSLGGPDWAPIPPGVEVLQFTGYTTWHLCIYIAGDTVRAELSVLHDFDSGYFKQCFERIIILGFGDWDRLVIRGDEDDGPDLQVRITRK
jgi:hypothetical protein